MNTEQDQDFAEPGGGSEQAAVSFSSPEQPPDPYAAPPAHRPHSPITGVVERHRAQLSMIDGVHGVAEGRTSIGDDAVRIDVEDDSIRERLPKKIEGYPVEVVVVPGGFGILPAGSPYTG